MNIRFSLIVLAALGLGTLPCGAQAPAGSTGLCKDGAYTTAAKKRGACKDHAGVKAWFGAPIPQAPLPPPSPEASAAAKSPTPAVADSTATSLKTVAPAQAAVAPPSSAIPSKPQSPADAIKVWVNVSSKVYHCPGSEWYGKTQSGKYMSQADAIAMGARPAYSKPCLR